ncbi:unnamed protein product [Brachionus calyciflorus]|uniref:Uncharacterized protein n=1 Tax=Brachionus calyciflorus TaxID=104777 RepID=A0A813Y8D2_9BILA|nr:unnamed protein product [Brachionus calyciflorus]
MNIPSTQLGPRNSIYTQSGDFKTNSIVDIQTSLITNDNIEFKNSLSEILSNNRKSNLKSNLKKLENESFEDISSEIIHEEIEEKETISDKTELKEDANKSPDNNNTNIDNNNIPSSNQLDESSTPQSSFRKLSKLFFRSSPLDSIKQISRISSIAKDDSSNNKTDQTNSQSFNENSSMFNETALEKFGSVFGPEQSTKLIYTNNKYLKTEQNKTNDRATISSKSSLPPGQHQNDPEINQKKRNKIHEYYTLEKKQADLIKLLAKSILFKFNEENKKDFLCDQDEINKVFSIVSELEQVALLIHDSIAESILKRLNDEWNEKPYFADILMKYYQYYKIYKTTLSRYPNVQLSMANFIKKKNVAITIKKLLDAEAANLENVNRLDMLFDRLVDFPRRINQLLESYIKQLDQDSSEYTCIKEIMIKLINIFQSSDEDLNRMQNFQLCYDIQYMFDPPLLTLVDANRQLVKQGPIFKVAKRDGNLLLRHLALFTDILLVCNCDKFKRKLILKYRIETKNIKLVENSNQSNELDFRIISSDQNNEFRADKLKDKEEWMRAFKKVKDIISTNEFVYCPNDDQLGKVPPVWIKDNAQTACSTCNESFTAFRRRHHCRTCGKLFCNSCCSLTVPVEFNKFKDPVRVCNSCFITLNKTYQAYLNQTNQSPIASPNMFNNILKNFIPSKQTNDFQNETQSEIQIQEELENVKPTPFYMNDVYRPSYNKTSRIAFRKSLEKSDSTNTINNDDDSSRSSFSDDEKLIELEDKKEINDVKPVLRLQSIKPIVPPRPSTITQNQHISKIFVKREPVYQENGYFNKIQIKKDLQTELENSPNKNSCWERVCFILYTDHTLGICSSHLDFNNPKLLIQLNYFNIKNVNDTTFGLDRILDDLIEVNLNESDIESIPKGRLNNRLKMFEFNFELKFQTKDTKNKWFELVSNEKRLVG